MYLTVPEAVMSNTILDEYVDVAEVAADFEKCERTILRWMDAPDGLPYLKIGNKRLVHVPTARAWLLGRMKTPNPR
jgi:hypothetical protein